MLLILILIMLNLRCSGPIAGQIPVFLEYGGAPVLAPLGPTRLWGGLRGSVRAVVTG